MAIDPQFANLSHARTPSADPVEQLKAQAKIQMAQTTAELEGSKIVGPTADHPPLPSAVSNGNSGPKTSTPTDSSVPNSAPAPAVPRSLPPAHIAKTIPCRFHAIGSCKYGDSCAFSHVLAPSTGAVALLPGMLNASANVTEAPIGSASAYQGPPSSYVLPPHPAQTYEEAAVRRYYGFCDSNPLPPSDQPLDSAPIPPPTSSASTPADGPLPVGDQHPYYPPATHHNPNYDGYYPPGPPPSTMSHGFPPGQQVMNYGPDVSSPVYYAFPGSMPPHNLYGPMPPHCPQGYYEPPPPADVAFDGYPINHPVSVGPEDPTAPAPVPHPHPNPEAMYFQQYPPYPPHPNADGLPCAPMGDYPSNHLPLSSPDSNYYPPVDTSKEGNHPTFRPVDGYALPGPHRAPSEPFVPAPGPGAPRSANPNGPGPVNPTHPAPTSGLPRFTRHCNRGMGNSRRGHHTGRGGRPMRPRLSTGFNSGAPRAQSSGSGPNSASAQPPVSSTAGPLSASCVTSSSPLASSVTGEDRGPRGPCSFFAENRCRFGDECIWAHVMPNGDDAREYKLNYVGPEVISKDGVLGSEVGFGHKMTRKMDGFDSRSIPGYALWEKRYKDPFRKGAPKERSVVGGGEGGKEVGPAVVDNSRSMRQKVDELVQARREGSIPGSHPSSYRTNRGGFSGGPPRSHQFPNGPSSQLKHLGISANRNQRVPSGEDFPALRSIPASVSEKALVNGEIHKEERNLNDEDGSSNSCGTEASGSTRATSTKDSPGLPAPKSIMPVVIEGGSFALAAARGASVPTPVKQKSTPAAQAASIVSVVSTQVVVATDVPTSSLSNGVEEAFKSLEIDSSACEVAASA